LAILSGKKKRQKNLADLAPPRGKSRMPEKLAGCGVTSGRRLGLAHFSNGLYFFGDFSKLT
jgi:hypothetical protein